MKKLLLLSIILFAIMSCSDKERTEQTIIVEVYYNDNGVESRIEAFAWIFEDADYDFVASWRSLSNETNAPMTLTNGNKIFAKYTPNHEGLTTNVKIEDVKNGQYIIVIIGHCGNLPPRGSLYGYRRITVNKDIHNIPQKIVFTENDHSAGIILEK